MSDIPEELVLQFLVRLPTKSLLRFRSVCKSWFLLINSSNFISLHKLHNHAIGNYNILFRHFCNTQKKEIYSLYDEKCSFSPFRTIGELDFPFDRTQGSYYTIVSCVNGLICLWDDTNELNPVTLWNPAIRKSYQVPFYCNVSDSRSSACLKLSFGFGFDALANDYKILRIAFCLSSFSESRRVDRRPLSFLTKPVVCSADIFSLNTKSWRCVNNFVPLQQLSVPVFVNGALHFLTRKDDNQCCIVSFSLNAETFLEMACPQGGKLNIDSDHRIVGSSGTIFLLHQFPGYRYDIWVMKEYNVEESWTKLLSIELDMHPVIGWKHLISINRNGGLILCGPGSWIGYPVVEAVEIMDLQPLGSYFAPHAEVYSESLVLLGDDNCVTHLLQNNGDNIQEEHKKEETVIRRVPGKRRGQSARLNSII
ncbi:F-box/kelch-repeat protein At3g23880-like [Chenopodium quinoa]|uniref:F-box/kelch-repeat protein At3g23880-like n=1 Tax=Chenopodium quinoa TaxID=63459 RepID=UPI000B7718B7|nr:F-box/kelch-repeat protein At3g23880-like [Chenopodium quinoa]